MLSTVSSAPMPQTFFHHFDPIHVYDDTVKSGIYGVQDNIEIYHKDAFVNPEEAFGFGRVPELSHGDIKHEVPSHSVLKSSHTNVVITDHQGDDHRTTVIEILPEYENNRPRHLSVDDYVKRLKVLKIELKKLGYGELTEDKYKELILSGGFVHNKQHYVYNSEKHSFIVHNAQDDHAKKVVPLSQ